MIDEGGRVRHEGRETIVDGRVNIYHFINADERSRTSTPIREQAPEACASANSATSASVRVLHGFYKTRTLGGVIINGIRFFVKQFSINPQGQSRVF